MLNRQAHRQAAAAQDGFTIVELMIATAIFSVLLLVITAGILRFTTEYYKGVTSAKTQNTAQDILNTISQDIQFSPSGSINLADASNFCVGGHEYMYRSNTQVTDGTSADSYHGPHALLENTASSNCTMPAGVNIQSGAPLPTGVRELVGLHMRLADLEITPLGSGPQSQLYHITLRLVYGDDDLLCNQSTTNCSSSTPAVNLGSNDLTCKSQTGSQFCAVSELSTIVQKRLQ